MRYDLEAASGRSMEGETAVETSERPLVPIQSEALSPTEPPCRFVDRSACVARAGRGAASVWDELFAGEIRNLRNRAVHKRAVR